MGLNSDTGKGTVYINGEPFSEVSEIKIAPRQKEPPSFPLTFENISFTLTIDCPKWFWRKLKWLIFKAQLKALAVEILQKLGLKWRY